MTISYESGRCKFTFVWQPALVHSAWCISAKYDSEISLPESRSSRAKCEISKRNGKQSIFPNLKSSFQKHRKDCKNLLPFIQEFWLQSLVAACRMFCGHAESGNTTLIKASSPVLEKSHQAQEKWPRTAVWE